jgi:hypothetical protein
MTLLLETSGIAQRNIIQQGDLQNGNVKYIPLVSQERGGIIM